ncbi:v-SNARE N-terminal domain-containing protein [Winogradskyella bathintestinalis]|uniref:Uncharacterized protein n=1 Tax=Winogradskyella bathintestinalis TaxID=3035208 RepID=A0ABT7ZYY0_9FLAO|nr:hypothetical protein [Winogradskyella bathintestinalis]MDN3494192.1 hypothetical protein [Winogradskyella bathintestinalis]
MACRSASVRRAQKKSEEALKAIKKLEKNISDLAKSEEAVFESKIREFQEDIGVDDLEKLDGNSAVKVDFTHEFNADTLIPVITNVLKTAASLISGAGTAAVILTNPENIKTYADLLSSIAESIKTNSSTGANTSFSMNRLAPGFFSFTSTKSMTISDKETFGEESITATTFYYQIYFSKKHAVKFNDWTSILTLIEMIRKLNDARIGIVDRLVSNEFTLAEFTKLSDSYKAAIEKHESELSMLINETSVVEVMNKAIKKNYSEKVLDTKTVLSTSMDSKAILNNAIELFGNRGSLYSNALQEAQYLLKTTE